jgi:branched-chain amino acid transport system permease protein
MRGDYLAIATLGFAEIFRHLANDSPWLGGSRGLKVHNVVRSLAVELQGFPPAASTSGMPEAQAQALRNALDRAGYAEMAFYLVLSWGAVALIWCLLLRLMRSGHGRAIRAIRDDEAVAELMGVNLTRYKVLVFVLGAGLAGLAGAIYAHTRRYPTPDQFNFMQGVTIVAMVVLGGMGSFSGTVLAAAVIYLLPVLLSFAPEAWRIPVFYDPTQGGLVERSPKDLWQVFFALVLITVILVRPQGLLGRRELSPGALWRRLRRGSFRAAAGGAP